MFAVVDLETTGSHPDTDRIIEIAICVHDGQQMTGEFTTLVNPEMPIPPFISRLTQITDSMVEKAPTFSSIANRVLEMLQGKVFVAHNVTFDYGFLKLALLREGYEYQNHMLCTCKTSRNLIPGHHSYSLPRLCRSLEIEHGQAHRASADARAAATILGMLFEKTGGKLEPFFHIPEKKVNLTRIPDEQLDKLPRKAGVLYMYDEQGNVLFLTKAANVRKKAYSLVSRMKSRRFAVLAQHAVSADAVATGNEMMAAIKEINELLRLQPRWNRKVHSHEKRTSIFESCLSNEVELHISTFMADSNPLVTFNTSREAKMAYEEAKQFLNGNEPGEIATQTTRQTIEWLQSKRKNKIITLHGSETGSLSYVVIRNAAFAGWLEAGNLEPHLDVDSVLERMQPGKDHPAVYGQILRLLDQKKYLGIREF